MIGLWTDLEIARLDPSIFAMVMATGIISNTFDLQRRRVLSDALFVVALLVYLWLWLLTGLRAARHPRALWTDLASPARVFSFFTIVAATDVLGAGIAARGFPSVAFAMWVTALALWLILIYLAFGTYMFRNTSGGAKMTDGAWLNAIVATQSLVILGGTLAWSPAAAPEVSLLIHMLWTIGLALYGILVVLLAHQLFFFELRQDDIGPLLWVVMGAAAISTNAGSVLAGTASGELPFVQSMRPFVDGVTLAMWAWATWWIPILFLLGIWKHGMRGVPITYAPVAWSIVFPLGMHAIASLRLAQAADIPALAFWSEIMVWIALAAWIVTAFGLIAASWRSGREFIRQAVAAVG